MSGSNDLASSFQQSLKPYIKPREQVNYIRRILALHLSTSDEPTRQPLALVSPEQRVEGSEQTQGIYREYLEAIEDHRQARNDFNKALNAKQDANPKERDEIPSQQDLLTERLALLRLYQKRERLSTIRDYLDELADKPAATADFLDAQKVFQGAGSLPPVPIEIVQNVASEDSGSGGSLEETTRALEKTVLRAKLLLKKEEHLLREVRLRFKGPQDISHGSRLKALEATRNELITWVESELSKAGSAEAGDGDAKDPQNGKSFEEERAEVDGRLRTVKDKYAQYVSSRKELLVLMSQQAQELRPPATPPKDSAEPLRSNTVPTSYLITPYVEALLSASRLQKSTIGHKSQMKTAFTKQNQHSQQTLGHLAEEGQLLLAYPMKDSMRRRSGLHDEFASRPSEQTDLARRVLPWVFAADSTKIATLEEVAEKVEKGQIALEDSMRHLQAVDDMLGRESRDNEEDKAQRQAVDSTTDAGERSAIPRRQAGKNRKKQEEDKKDIWARIHGNLGLIGHEESI